jgi:hypothetical protein
MQKWVCMAVRPKSNRKRPLRRATCAQFRFTSAPNKAGALRGLGSAGHAWHATSHGGAHERQHAPPQLTPSKRSHTYASW